MPPAVPLTTTTTTAPSFTPYLVADIHSAVPGFASPGGRQVTTVPDNWYGYPSDLTVVTTSGSWLDVRLATRPNQSTAWIQMSPAVTLANSKYRIVINLAAMHLELYRDNDLVLYAPAGIGTPTDPTPTGHYFVTVTVPPPSPGYGPFVVATSDHSDAITDWDGTGDAIIAIHGPIDAEADAEIGTTGAAISHGCIRLHDSDLAQLGQVPAGTPIDIVSG